VTLLQAFVNLLFVGALVLWLSGVKLFFLLMGLFLLGALVLWGLKQLRRPTVQGLPPDKPVWMLDAVTNLPNFYRQLTTLVPAESVLCIEGVRPERSACFSKSTSSITPGE